MTARSEASRLPGIRIIHIASQLLTLILKTAIPAQAVTYNSYLYSLFYDKVIAKDLSGNVVDLEGKKLIDVWDFTAYSVSFPRFGDRKRDPYKFGYAL